VLVIFFEFYSSMASFGLGMLTCLKVPALAPYTKRHWVLDIRLQCPLQTLESWWGKLALFLGIALLLICIVWPLALALVLWRRARQGQLHADPSAAKGGWWAFFKANLTFRFSDYRVNEFNYLKSETHNLHPVDRMLVGVQKALTLTWDSILDMQRIVLAAAALLVTWHEMHQIMLVTLILGIYLVLILAVQPWRSPAIWRLQVMAVSVLVLSCCGIMASNVGDTSAHYSESEKDRYSTILPWLVIAINLLYVIVGIFTLVYCIARDIYRWRFGRQALEGNEGEVKASRSAKRGLRGRAAKCLDWVHRVFTA
jgi:hypothetical protein